jgi:hypothetical protein
MALKWLKLDREWIDDLNLRPSRANREKQSISKWEGRGERCGYSEL